MAALKRARKEAERYPYGPRPLAALLPALTDVAFRRRSPLAARMVADWETIVGPAIAAVTAPMRCAGGVLSISCSGAVALELQHLAPKLIERINIHFGSVLVKRLTFRQITPQIMPSGPAASSHDAATPSESEAALQAHVAGLDDGPVREALLKLGRAMRAAEKMP